MDNPSDLTNREQFDIPKESSADRDERLFRPLVEPIDVRCVRDGRELPAAHSESTSDRRETEHNLSRQRGRRVSMMLLHFTLLSSPLATSTILSRSHTAYKSNNIQVKEHTNGRTYV